MPDQSEAPIVLACPFCGSPAEEGTDDRWGSFVFCTDEVKCNALQHGFPTERLAIEAWNTRPEAAEIIRLCEEALDKARECLAGRWANGKVRNAALEMVRAARAKIKGQNP